METGRDNGAEQERNGATTRVVAESEWNAAERIGAVWERDLERDKNQERNDVGVGHGAGPATEQSGNGIQLGHPSCKNENPNSLLLR